MSKKNHIQNHVKSSRVSCSGLVALAPGFFDCTAGCAARGFECSDSMRLVKLKATLNTIAGVNCSVEDDGTEKYSKPYHPLFHTDSKVNLVKVLKT